MKKQILITSTLFAIFAFTKSQPIGSGDADINNNWKTTSIQTWPWTPGLTTAYMNPTYFNSDYLSPHLRLIDAGGPYRITPTYFVRLAAPGTNIAQEVSAELTNKGKRQYERKLSAKAPQIKGGDLKSDEKLLEAIQKINPQFVIEDIFPVPGQHIPTDVSSQKPFNPKAHSASVGVNSKTSAIKKQSKRKLKIPKSSSLEHKTSDNEVKVEARGRTATSGTIPQIPFGTYFLPYFAKGQQDDTKIAALILEPHSKAVVGNGGTAVSRPISKAYLKRGVPTNVYFNPESVAIAGVGGKAHAQADLELDLVDY